MNRLALAWNWIDKNCILVIFFFIGVPIIRLAPGSILPVCLESSTKDAARVGF